MRGRRERRNLTWAARRECDLCGDRSYDVRPGLARVDGAFVLAVDRCRDRDACERRATDRIATRATAG